MDGDGLAPGVFCNIHYIRTIPGILKLIQMVCDFLALILGAAGAGVDGGSGNKGFFIFVTVVTLVITLAIFIICLLHVQSVCLPQRWPLIELVWCIIAALFLFIGSIVIAVIGKYNGIYGAAAFFGFAAFIAFVADAIYRFRFRGSSSGMSRQEAYAANQPGAWNPPGSTNPPSSWNAAPPPANPPSAWSATPPESSWKAPPVDSSWKAANPSQPPDYSRSGY